jgi:hypothetical protein
LAIGLLDSAPQAKRIANPLQDTILPHNICENALVYLIKPSLRNLFMKKLTLERVVPIVFVRVSWLIRAITVSGVPLSRSWPAAEASAPVSSRWG